MLINIGAHGIGDCILSLQISSILHSHNVEHINLISSSQEVFEALNFIFGQNISIKKIDEKYSANNAIINQINLQQEISSEYSSDHITYNIPDLLFKHPLAFDFKKYGLFMNSVRKHRILPSGFSRKENIIYCGLCSVHEYHIYKYIPLLLTRLAEFLPDYTIYFPHISHWNRDMPYLGDFSCKFPKNVWIDYNPSFKESLSILSKSVYGLFTDNGPSHIAYHLGIPRLILDPEYNNILWMCRWKDDMEECLPISTQVNDIVNVIYQNIKCPQSTLINKPITQHITQQSNPIDWGNYLLFKH